MYIFIVGCKDSLVASCHFGQLFSTVREACIASESFGKAADNRAAFLLFDGE
jgi:hypothetical protein